MKLNKKRFALLKKLALWTYLPAALYFAWYLLTTYPDHWPEAAAEKRLTSGLAACATMSGTLGILSVFLSPFLRLARRRRRRSAPLDPAP